MVKNLDYKLVVTLFLLLVIFVDYDCGGYVSKYRHNAYVKKVSNLSFNGKVVRIYIDKQNHAHEFYVLNDSSKNDLSYRDISGLIHVGDSIVKSKNTTFIQIFRADSSFIHQFPVEYIKRK